MDCTDGWCVFEGVLWLMTGLYVSPCAHWKFDRHCNARSGGRHAGCPPRQPPMLSCCEASQNELPNRGDPLAVDCSFHATCRARAETTVIASHLYAKHMAGDAVGFACITSTHACHYQESHVPCSNCMEIEWPERSLQAHMYMLRSSLSSFCSPAGSTHACHDMFKMNVMELRKACCAGMSSGWS